MSDRVPYRRPLGLVSISCALASCAATLPVGTVDGHAGSRHTGAAPATADLADHERIHEVQAGETLWRIAQNHTISVDALMSLNGITDPTTLAVGQKLRIPGGPPSQALARARALVQEPTPGKKPEISKPSAKPPKPAEKPVAKGARKAKRTPSKRVSVARYPLRWPVRGTILKRYGRRGKKHHDGIDIGAGAGAPVAAAASGKVVFADEHGGYGKLVLLRHSSGLITVYAHQSELLVSKGQSVRGGDVIARVGSSGNAETPHLHFEVRKGVETKNPLQFLPP
ncbi:MAG: M23 family metallopeptidase [Myxococcota bacterium]